MQANILVVDDEKEIADLVQVYLENEGFAVYKCYTGKEALKVIEEKDLDLALLDVMLPEMDGFSLCRIIRQKHTWPVIMLTARGEEMDKINSLSLGADDYIAKPFNPLELTARVKSLLRRYTQLGAIAENKPAVFRIGGLVMDDERKEVTVDGEPVKLTPIEYRILLLLVQNPGKVFSITQIYERIWNEEALGGDNTVAVHIRHIREKIEINPKEPRYLKVVWGVGYKIDRE